MKFLFCGRCYQTTINFVLAFHMKLKPIPQHIQTMIYLQCIHISMMWSGDGGSAGVVIFRARKINGEVTIGTCAGKGAAAARNGRGGKGKRKLETTTLWNRGIRFDTVSIILLTRLGQGKQERQRHSLLRPACNVFIVTKFDVICDLLYYCRDTSSQISVQNIHYRLWWHEILILKANFTAKSKEK